jgi:hypothetical protein
VTDRLRIALLSYRGKPTCGGQGVYIRHLSRELAALGHHVEVIGGPPYPVLDDGVRFTPLPGLDLYAPDNPFRTPALRELRTLPNILEYTGMKTGRFTEPLAFSLRARAYLRRRPFDVVHDNQGLGYGLLGLPGLVATIHHPSPSTANGNCETPTSGAARKSFPGTGSCACSTGSPAGSPGS